MTRSEPILVQKFNPLSSIHSHGHTPPSLSNSIIGSRRVPLDTGTTALQYARLEAAERGNRPVRRCSRISASEDAAVNPGNSTIHPSFLDQPADIAAAVDQQLPPLNPLQNHDNLNDSLNIIVLEEEH